jgi:pyroglutamyl-peptidase
MSDAARLLLTGFEPFSRFLVNPSWLAAEQMEREFAPRVVSRCLPVDLHLARVRLIEILQQLRPSMVLSMGLAAGDEFRIECSARKVIEFDSLTGPSGHRISMNCDRLGASLEKAHAPWRLSEDAGRYVCESTYWALLEYASQHGSSMRCAFLHVPAESESWPVARTIGVVRQVVSDLLDTEATAHSDNRLA